MRRTCSSYRDRLAKRGILVIGPNCAFMRYIDQVLPSLGENDVVLATVGSLFPASRPPAAARVKGDARMAAVLAKTVTGLQQVPAELVEIRIDGSTYKLTPKACAHARAKARRQRDRFTLGPLAHNEARRFFVDAMLDVLTPARRSGNSTAGGSCSPTTRRTCAPSWRTSRRSARHSTRSGRSIRRSSCWRCCTPSRTGST